MTKERVVVAMSGGVDSAVAAGLLAREGYDVVGVTMRLWAQEDVQAPRYHRRCCSVEDIDDARGAADVLGIPHYVVNLEAEFAENVVDYFVGEYGRGRTPNPCLPCNEHVKFRALMRRAEALEGDYLATGHYAQLRREGDTISLHRSVDGDKDQSYVLYMLGQQELGRVLFPIGSRTKEEIRGLAREFGLPNADKPDSADICFLPTEDYRTFIAERIRQEPGDIVDVGGEVVGQHDGVAGFTIGQRKGLGIALGEKRYVTSIDPQLNVITIGPEDRLLSRSLSTERPSWVAGETPGDEFEADVAIRYRSQAQPARVSLVDDGALVEFVEPQRAVAAGQAAVFYRGDEVLGGAIIASAEPA